jgi:hypothetical protein
VLEDALGNVAGDDLGRHGALSAISATAKLGLRR